MPGVFGGVRFEGRYDPSAGVALAPRLELCPRCGVSKGAKGQARRGLCRDCRAVLGPDRAKWVA